MEGEPIEPALGVFEGGEHAGPAKGFGACGIASGEALEDLPALRDAEETCCEGVIGDEDVGGAGHEDGKEALEDEDPAPAGEATDTFHE